MKFVKTKLDNSITDVRYKLSIFSKFNTTFHLAVTPNFSPAAIFYVNNMAAECYVYWTLRDEMHRKCAYHNIIIQVDSVFTILKKHLKPWAKFKLQEVLLH